MSIISVLFYQSNCCHFIYTFVIMLLFNNCHISHIHDLKKKIVTFDIAKINFGKSRFVGLIAHPTNPKRQV
jgi:hypothetical protein